MALAGFISKIVQSITRTTFQFNKTLDVLIDRFKDGCPPYTELKALITQKNQIDGAIQQIQQKIITLNKIAAGSEIAADALSKGKTVIKQLPIPSSIPPGVGLPLSVMNNLSDALDNLGTLIDKEKASLDSIPEALDLISKDVGGVITKLKEFNVAINICAEKDPNLTQEDLDDAREEIGANTLEIVEVLTNEDLEELLNEPPGLLYGGYYLRLNYINSEFSFDKKQIIAQNKESVNDEDNPSYNAGAAVEELLGDESFSSSNIVLVDEMKWLIDTKDLIFLPPPPVEDPLKAIYRENQIIILMSIYGADREEAEELYEMAWEYSQGRGPNASNYSYLVEEAFNNSRTILEQAVANEGYEFEDGDRILDATLKKLFLPGVSDSKLKGLISQIRRNGTQMYQLAESIGGDYNRTGKRWNNDGYEFEAAGLYPYSERLAFTAESSYNDNTLGIEFVSLRPEMAKRKYKMQAMFEAANSLSIFNPDISFNDPLKDYFKSKGFGYNTPIINTMSIIGDSNSPITVEELESLYEYEKVYAESYMANNWDTNIDPWTTPDGVNIDNFESYAKTQLFLKLRTALGNNWYNSKAVFASELPFWYLDGNPNSPSSYYNDPNYSLDSSNLWYFEFGKNGLPVPTGS